MDKKVVIGADYAGWELKREIYSFLVGLYQLGFSRVRDISEEKPKADVDYPRVAEEVAHMVADVRNESIGILIGETGIGMSMAANKVKGIRAAACYTKSMAVVTRSREDSNILCLGGGITAPRLAIEIVQAWLETLFVQEERYHRRITQIGEIEAKQGFLEGYVRASRAVL